MDAAEVVGHGVGDVVAHAHRAGVVVRRAEVVATVLERGECGQPLRPRTGRYRDGAVGVGEDLERLVAGEDECDLVGYRVHRIPCGAVVVGLRTAGKLLRAGLGVAEMDNRLRAPEVAFLGREVDEAVGIARRHVADAANGDDDRVVVGAAACLRDVPESGFS